MNKKIYYKGFDQNLKCRDFQFEIGKTFEVKGDIKICNNGFHFCENLKDVLEYYPVIENNSINRFCEIEVIGEIAQDGNKYCSNKIKILKELTREELIIILNCKNNNLGVDNLGDSNTGDWNTGDWNSGNRNTRDWNTGDRNTGDRNSGDRNTGDRNSGDWNSGNRNTGDRNTGNSNTGDSNTGDWNTGDRNSGDWNKCSFETGSFNSKQSNFINIFNKKCKREVWDNAEKPDFIFDVCPNKWISIDIMTVEEIKKIEKTIPNLKNQGGYLKNITMEEAWKIVFDKASDRDIELLKKLPNYSYKVFKEISGIEDKKLRNK